MTPKTEPESSSPKTPLEKLYRQIGALIAILTWTAALGLFLWVLQHRWSSVPALGPLLDPSRGIWASHGSIFETNAGGETLKITGLSAPVTVKVDRDQVKHIFAQNDEDLYLAQGFVVASDRLWQMDFISRVAAGRLSEMVGPRGLEFDKMFTKLGLPEAAKESAALMSQDLISSRAITSFSKGVNAFIKTLGPESLPFEYKLLGVQPASWSPEKAALLLKFMAYNLCGFSRDLQLSRSFASLSPDDFKDLFPLDLQNLEPIVPKGTKWNFNSRAPAPPKYPFHPDLQKITEYHGPNPANGSNNWAVSGKKSTTDLPILSNDVHLGLSLPSLWYEMQLVSPTQNVYGVTIPGAPGIILGFNRSLAWGSTNGGSDVLDWFELRYRDQRKSEYVYDGNWRPVISREVEIPVRGQKPLTLTLRRTHLGPIVYDDGETSPNPQIPPGLAMKWAALEPSNELKTFLLLNRANTTEDCKKALENSYDTPGQNFLCADNKNDVGLWHTGRIPIRWRGQGRLIGDGTSSVYDWKGWIPRNELPGYRNPERGFLSSANQKPTDDTYPNYLGWPYESPFRAMRINELLRAKRKFSPTDFMTMQSDTLSIPARTTLPTLLKALDVQSLNEQEKKVLELLNRWDFRFEEDSGAGAVYVAWFAQIEKQMWEPHFPDASKMMRPPIQRTLEIINNEPNSKWFDDPSTPQHETLKEIATSGFHRAVSIVSRKLGSANPDRWTWSSFHPTDFTHIGKIPGLGDEGLAARGMDHTIFANQGGHGPTWKMVVALGTLPKAWGIYPGGQSGDPASQHYDDFIAGWRGGQFRELIYLTKPSDSDPRLLREWTLEAKEPPRPEAKK